MTFTSHGQQPEVRPARENKIMQIFDFLIRLGSALLLGTLVGLERQWRQRMAGTRTNALWLRPVPLPL
jgi:hypothetical protein